MEIKFSDDYPEPTGKTFGALPAGCVFRHCGNNNKNDVYLKLIDGPDGNGGVSLEKNRLFPVGSFGWASVWIEVRAHVVVEKE